jgi:transposase
MASQGKVGYPSDVSDEEWGFVLPYLLLSREDSAHREHDLRAVFNGVRYISRTGNQWRFMPHDYPPWPAIFQQMLRASGRRHAHSAARVCRTQGPADGSVH